MKILLDECVPWPVRKLLTDHDCNTAWYQGWGGTKNGELLQLADKEFELFITADRNLRYQQNLVDRKIAILELSTNDLRRIQSAALALQAAVRSMKTGEYRLLEIP